MSEEITMDPAFSNALRAELLARVTTRKKKRGRTAVVGGGIAMSFVLAPGLAIGLGGTLPGGMERVVLGEAVHAEAAGSAPIDLGDRPEGATALSMTLTCVSVGTFRFDQGSSLTCGEGEEGSVVTVYLPIASRTTIQTTPGAQWQADVAYVNESTSPWATNERGDTYGVANAEGEPDLVAAVATNGKQGYVRNRDLRNANGSVNFATPEEALNWQESVAGTSVSLPVLESDGVTEIGVFTIQR